MIGAAGNITELKERERQLAEQTAEQAAVRELLEAISRSAFDLDAVLRTLIESATRLPGPRRGSSSASRTMCIASRSTTAA